MYRLVKRGFDVLFSAILCLILFPFFLIAFFLVKVDSKGPFFFFQERLGEKGKVFKVYKIRTMTDKPRNPSVQVHQNSSEVTRVGNVLRRFKIDEIPQIINILRGDMSFVGPRPSMPELRHDFDENGKKRMLVRPGLTGLAQTNGNIFLTWEERWYYDKKYVEGQSLLMDLSILIKTVFIVLLGEKYFLKKPNA